MAISQELHEAIRKQLKLSPPVLSRRANALRLKHGPMSGDEARWVIAHDGGLDLKKFGLTGAQLDRVRELRIAAGQRAIPIASAVASRSNRTGRATVEEPLTTRAEPPVPSRSMLFASRSFHPAVAKASRKLFVDGHPTEAIHKSLQGVINRVKKLSGLGDDDGQTLMNRVFSEKTPLLQTSGLSTKSEKDEHSGMRYLMVGATAALRNPRAHEDHWEQDSDAVVVLEVLAVASLLHRFLDRCAQWTQEREAQAS